MHHHLLLPTGGKVGKIVTEFILFKWSMKKNSSRKSVAGEFKITSIEVIDDGDPSSGQMCIYV